MQCIEELHGLNFQIHTAVNFSKACGPKMAILALHTHPIPGFWLEADGVSSARLGQARFSLKPVKIQSNHFKLELERA